MNNDKNEKMNNLFGEEAELIEEMLGTESKSYYENPWPKNLYETIFGKDYENPVQLNGRAEGVFLEVLQTLTPREEKVMLLRYKEHKTLEEVGREFCVTRDRIKEIESTTIRRLRHPHNAYRIRQQGILVGQDGPLPDPVPTEEQKETILRIAKERGLTKEKVNIAFVMRNIRMDYGIALALVEYLKETL